MTRKKDTKGDSPQGKRSDLSKLSLPLQVDFVNTPLLYRDRASCLEIANLALWFVPEAAQSNLTSQKHTTTQLVMPEMTLKPMNVCLTHGPFTN